MKVHAKIFAYRISNGALAATELPPRLKFLDWGDSQSLKGPLRVNAMTATHLPTTQKAKGWDRIALDFEHSTLTGTPEYERSQEPKAVAAYGVVVCMPGDGLYLDDLQWTPHGKTFAREYIDLSPAPLQMADGTVTGIHSVALCRHGAIPGTQFYSVELPDKQTTGDAIMKWLLGWLGKSEDAKDTELQAGFAEKITALCAEALKGMSAELGTRIAELKTKIEAYSAESATLTALSADVTNLKSQISTFSAAIEQRDRADVVAGAAREGKVIPLSAEDLAKTPVKTLQDMVGKLPVTVPLEARTPEHVKAYAVDGGLTTAIETVARACGVDPKKVIETK